MATNSYSNLKSVSSAWNSALRDFGIVDVMNAKVYNVYDGMTKTEYTALTAASTLGTRTLTEVFEDSCGSTATKIDFSTMKVNEIIALYLATEPVTELKYLKTANAPQEGPKKTITGGQNANILLKYGKSARLEMQNALGNAEALEALGGMTVEYFRSQLATAATLKTGATDVLHATNLFAPERTIIGETFLVDAKSGAQVDAYIIFYNFLPESLMNLTQDAEGDATVFDMNGDLRVTKVFVGDKEATGDTDGIVVSDFYAILPKLDYAADFDVIVDNGI